MKIRKLNLGDLFIYKEDVIKCYDDNHLIFDSQSPLLADGFEGAYFLSGYIQAKDSIAVGVFVHEEETDEEHLRGIVLFDNIRFGDKKSCAEVHIATAKELWGKEILKAYREILSGCIFTTIYCMIPKIAVAASSIAKRVGFKKTGYIPNALPYINSKGEEHMYDLIVYTLERDI